MKNYLIFTILIIIFISLHYVDAGNKLNIESVIVKSNKDLARTRRRPFGFFNPLMGYGFGLHALAIVYWLKVKAVIIAFIVGTAIVWGSKYFWPNKACPKQIETTHEGAIIPFEHGPIWSSHNHYSDHFPYSSSLSFSDHEHEPYSAYSSYSDSSPPSGPADGTEQYLDHNPHDKKWKRKSRSVRQQEQQFENENTEDQISELMFLFLGVGSTECRKRFLCEWEFQAQKHPLTRMAFRIFGRGVFRKYAHDPKDENSAKSFRDCARVHNQCTVIEEDNYSDYTQSQSNNNESENSINNPQELIANDPIAKTIFSRPLKRNKKKNNNLFNANFDFQKK